MPVLDAVSSQAEDPKCPRNRGFLETSRTVRFLILLFFGALLFLLLHFREVKVEILEIGSIAPEFLVSQVDFDFPDDEATVIVRQDAIRDVGKIYQISGKEVRQKRVEFENFLLYNQAWHESAEGGVFEELYLGVDTLEKALLQLRLTDPQTIEKMKEAGFTFDGYQVHQTDVFNPKAVFSEDWWRELVNTRLASPFYTPLTKSLLLEFFQTGQWTLDEDIPAQRALRKKIQAKVPEKISRVSAGSRIVNRGERVTARHVAMLQGMKHAIANQRRLFHASTLFGSFLMTLLFGGIFIAYLRLNQGYILSSNRKLLLLLTILGLVIGISKSTELFLLHSSNNLIETVRYPIFVPIAAILIGTLINPFVATFSSGFLTILFAIALAFHWEGMLIFNLVAAIAATLQAGIFRQRKEIFVVCAKTFLCTWLAVLSLHLYNNSFWDVTFITDSVGVGLFLFLTGVMVIGLLPLLESVFRVTTDATFMEYLDPNQELLRRLSMEAPGTYQHSVVVGNLAEAAALSIGANGLFCRVAALYHDVGKMATAQYFIENQMGVVNVHQLLTPQESAEVIISHVKDGVSLARAAHVPEPLVDIIQEHHGTTMVYYFYRKQLDLVGGDASLVDPKDFRYPGPKPRTKESGILMIADCFEAASRALDQPNETELVELIERLTREKIQDGQLEDCQLTFRELACIKKTIVKTLLAAGHSRIKYPAYEIPSPTAIRV